MSDAVSGNSGVEEEFLWTCTLTGADKVYDWSPEVGTWVGNIDCSVEKSPGIKRACLFKWAFRNNCLFFALFFFLCPFCDFWIHFTFLCMYRVSDSSFWDSVFFGGWQEESDTLYVVCYNKPPTSLFKRFPGPSLKIDQKM